MRSSARTATPPVNVREMARIFGATAFPLKKTDIVGPNYTINQAPKQEARVEAGPQQPDPATLEVIGLNQYGNTVLRGPDVASISPPSFFLLGRPRISTRSAGASLRWQKAKPMKCADQYFRVDQVDVPPQALRSSASVTL